MNPNFSSFGTLLATAEALVNSSPRGHSAEEVAHALNVEVHDALHQSTEQRRITRQVISGKYLYTAVDRTRQQAQLGARWSVESLPTLVDAGRLEIPEAELKAAILLFYSLLDEQQRPLHAGLEALKLGRGGDRQIAEFFDLDSHIVARKRLGLLAQDVEGERAHRIGGGRNRWKKRPK